VCEIYSVTYNVNNGSGQFSLTAQTVIGTLFTIAPNLFNTEAGKEFVGWSKTSTGDAEYTAGDQIGITSNLRLYAVWRDMIYTISVTGGTAAPESGIMGALVTLTDDPPAPGMFFIGWDVLFGNVTVDTDGRFTIGTENVVIVAKWDRYEYTIEVHGGTSDVIVGKIGDVITLIPGTAPDGKQFREWELRSGDGMLSGNTYIKGAEHAVIHALWDDVIYTISVTGGTASVESGIMGAPVTLTADPPAPGMFFAGWDVRSGGVEVEDGQFQIGTEHKVIVAVYDYYTYTIEVYGGTSNLTEGKIGTVITLIPGTAPAGKQFKEWELTSGDGMLSGSTYIKGAEHAVINAIWEDAEKEDDLPWSMIMVGLVAVIAALTIAVVFLIRRP
jgi:hypothetical protein